jgi:spore maturation protein CgeB
MSDVWSFKGQSILLVGNPGTIHVGAHLDQAAKSLALNVRFCDTTEAFKGPLWLTRFNWRVRGHRPNGLRKFSEQIVRACGEFRPRWMLSTGLAPVEGWALTVIGKLGIQRLNYLTDDPWNPAHHAPWFMKALPLYDYVFSTRRSNVEELHRSGCSRSSYLPFAYSPELHFSERPATQDECVNFASDVMFAGGADAERVPYIAALIRAGFKVALYGGYWERFRETKAYTRGHADPQTLRKTIGAARVALCLVRRANRDDNVMRTFEVPAIGACMLTEDTRGHREIFGDEGKAVLYFSTIAEMVEKLRWLLDHADERWRLANAAHAIIVKGRNTYKDRLMFMLKATAN